MNLGLENIFFIFMGICISLFICFIFYFLRENNNFGSLFLLKEIYKVDTIWKYIFQISTVCITLLFFLILSGPYLKETQTTIDKRGIDIEIILDVSYSMIAKDISPSRIDAAKSVIHNFLEEIYSDRVGIILFAGKPFHSVPLSYDYDFLKEFVSEITVDSINQNVPELQGTAIGDALLLGSDVLTSSSSDEEREKIIILITDGEANKGLDPEVAIKKLVSDNIKTYTIGIGKDEETFIEVYSSPGFTRKIPVGGLDENTLISIADRTGGEYFRADSNDDLKKTLQVIGDLEKTSLKQSITEYYTPIKNIPLILLWVFLVLFGYILYVKRIYV